MLTLEQKNERAFNLVDYSETPSLQFELLEVFTCEPDWRMKSLMGYHLMRLYFDNDSFTPEVELDMENVLYEDENLQQRYPDWTFYKVDRSLTDDMTAVIASEFAHVHRVETAHLSLEDQSLHRIFDTN